MTCAPRRTSVIARSLSLVASLALAAAAAGCGASGPHIPKTEGVDGRDQVDGASLGAMRLKPAVCSGVDTAPAYGAIDEQALVAFLKARGFPVRTVRARSDLVYVQMQLNPDKDEWVQLRVAILQTPEQAGRELHEAILQHGTGWWGVHRANLAVLVPQGSLDEIAAFVGRTKLACWGVLTVAGRDDSFVIPGGYREL